MTEYNQRLLGFIHGVLGQENCPEPNVLLFYFSAEENKWHCQLKHDNIVYLSEQVEEVVEEEVVYTEEDLDGREPDNTD